MHIPSHDTRLYIDDDTTVGEVVEYTVARISEPAVLDQGVVVFNFNNHDLDAQALVNADLEPGTYIVSYQVPGVWGFIQRLIPTQIREATLLTYRAKQSEYATYENFCATVDDLQMEYFQDQTRDALLDLEVTVDG